MGASSNVLSYVIKWIGDEATSGAARLAGDIGRISKSAEEAAAGVGTLAAAQQTAATASESLAGATTAVEVATRKVAPAVVEEGETFRRVRSQEENLERDWIAALEEDARRTEELKEKKIRAAEQEAAAVEASLERQKHKMEELQIIAARAFKTGSIGGVIGATGEIAGFAAAAGAIEHYVEKAKEMAIEQAHLAAVTSTQGAVLGAMRAAMEQAQVPVAAFPSQIVHLSRAMEEARDPASRQAQAFKQLGVDTQGWSKHLPSALDVLKQMAIHLHDSTNKEQDLAATSVTVGKSTLQLTAFLKEQGEELDKTIQKHMTFGEALMNAGPAAAELARQETILREQTIEFAAHALPAVNIGLKLVETVARSVMGVMQQLGGVLILTVAETAAAAVGIGKALLDIHTGHPERVFADLDEAGHRMVNTWGNVTDKMTGDAKATWDAIHNYWKTNPATPPPSGDTNIDDENRRVAQRERKVKEEEISAQEKHQVDILERQKDAASKGLESHLVSLDQWKAATDKANEDELATHQRAITAKIALLQKDPEAGPEIAKLQGERIAVEDKFRRQQQDVGAKYFSKRQADERKIAEETIGNDKKTAEALLQSQRRDIEEQEKLGLISRETSTKLLKDKADEEAKIEIEAIQKKAAIHANDPDNEALIVAETGQINAALAKAAQQKQDLQAKLDEANQKEERSLQEDRLTALQRHEEEVYRVQKSALEEQERLDPSKHTEVNKRLEELANENLRKQVSIVNDKKALYADDANAKVKSQKLEEEAAQLADRNATELQAIRNKETTAADRDAEDQRQAKNKLAIAEAEIAVKRLKTAQDLALAQAKISGAGEEAQLAILYKLDEAITKAQQRVQQLKEEGVDQTKPGAQTKIAEIKASGAVEAQQQLDQTAKKAQQIQLETQKQFEQIFNKMNSQLQSAFSGWISGTENFGKAFHNMTQKMAADWASSLVVQGARFIEHHLLLRALEATWNTIRTVLHIGTAGKILATDVGTSAAQIKLQTKVVNSYIFGEVSRMAATVNANAIIDGSNLSTAAAAGAAVETAAEAQAPGREQMVLGWAAVGGAEWAAENAWQGPAAAAMAFAQMFAVISGLGSPLAIAEKGALIGDQNTLTMLHPHEMVLPAPLSKGVQNLVAQGGPGAPGGPGGQGGDGGNAFHYHAAPGEKPENAKANYKGFTKHIDSERRRRNQPPMFSSR